MALHVAAITQGTTVELSIFMSTLATRSLCRLWMSRVGRPRRFYQEEMAFRESKEWVLFVLT